MPTHPAGGSACARTGRRPSTPERCREAFRGVPVLTGDVEASLRRVAHYDYWSDRVWPSNLVTSKADLLVHGMGERTLLAIARRLDAGASVADLRDLRGVAYLLGRSEALLEHRFDDEAGDGRTVAIPSFEEVSGDPRAFALATRVVHAETNPRNARRLTQPRRRSHPRREPAGPPPFGDGDGCRARPALYARAPPALRRGGETIPAWQTIRDSVQYSCAAASAAARSAPSRCTRAAPSRAGAVRPCSTIRAMARRPGVDLADQGQGPGLHVVGERLDVGGAAEGIDDVGHAALVRDHLLGAQREHGGGLARERKRFVPAFVCSDCVPPSTAARAWSVTRTTFTSICRAWRVEPAVCVWKRSMRLGGSFAPKRSRMMRSHIRRAARNLATSSKRWLWALKKKESRGAKASTSSPRSRAAST